MMCSGSMTIKLPNSGGTGDDYNPGQYRIIKERLALFYSDSKVFLSQPNHQ